VKNKLGDQVKEMWYIDGLFTAPSSQGQGYGGALLDAITSQVRHPFMPTLIIRHNPT
jgi:GNAT superfamily N-acetyltransferase